MIFVILGVLILTFSFVIALVSLLREQKPQVASEDITDTVEPVNSQTEPKDPQNKILAKLEGEVKTLEANQKEEVARPAVSDDETGPSSQKFFWEEEEKVKDETPDLGKASVISANLKAGGEFSLKDIPKKEE